MRTVFACILCLLSSVAYAAPPKVPAVTKVRVGEVVEVEIVADAAGKIGFHNPYDVQEMYVREAVPRREGTMCLLIQVKKEGIYRLAVWTVGEGVGATLALDATGGIIPVPPGPQPNPPGPNPPGPQPQPNPPITVEKPWLIVVEETTEKTEDTIRVMRDFAFWDSLPVEGWRYYDPNQDVAKTLKYDQLAKSTGIQGAVLMLVNGKGDLVKGIALPKTTAEVRKFVKDYVGK